MTDEELYKNLQPLVKNWIYTLQDFRLNPKALRECTVLEKKQKSSIETARKMIQPENIEKLIMIA